jgi:two-component system response regulator HydG
VPVRRLTPEAMQLLCDYPWPGNVRELENIIERTIVLSDGETIGPADVPFDGGGMGRPVETAAAGALAADATNAPLTQQLEGMERELICRAMQQAKGVKTQAAELLGIKTSALYYKLEKYDVDYVEEA